MSTAKDIQQLYIGYLGRAADQDGLDYWVNMVENEGWTLDDVAASFADQPEYDAIYGVDTDRVILVAKTYEQLFGREADDAGFDYWVNGDGKNVPDNLLVLAFINGASAADQLVVANKVEVADYYTTEAAAADAFNQDDARDCLIGVTGDFDTVTAAKADIDEDISGEHAGSTATLTDGVDSIVGTDFDDVFSAPVVQNQNGDLVNTLETGDRVLGGAGVDTLNVDLIDSQSMNIIGAPAISATTSEVEIVNLRAQYVNVDVAVNWSNIDAELMAGVEQYWDTNSRADIQIEDIRQLPEELTFGMQQTDPGVGYFVYFDPAQVTDARGTAGDSSLTLTLIDNANPDAELANFPVNGVVFTLGGVEYTVQSTAMGEADTYVDFAAALDAALDTEGLTTVTVTLNDNNTITLVDPAGATFEAVGYTWVDNIVPSGGELSWNMEVGEAIITDEPVTTDVVLDAVGRTSQGGGLDIGSMADGGVEQFNVSVDRSSWLNWMGSYEDFGWGDGHLEIVNLTSIGANGDLTIGDLGVVESYGSESGYWVTYGEFLDGRVVGGLWDVREVNNEGFLGELNLGIVLTDDSITRYLDAATEPVLFSYEGGDGSDNFTIEDWGVSFDPDFMMDVQMGLGDDRLNLDVPVVEAVTVDGGEGANIIAVSQSYGTETENTFADFANFQTYEVEGQYYTAHDFTSMQGVTQVNIATWDDWSTDEGASTTLIDLEAGTGITITGKNQTLETYSNNDQQFGGIDIFGADGEEYRITLQNTARVDGELSVDWIWVDDEAEDNLSAVRTLDIDSAGNRDTTNVVDELDAEMVNTFNITGTQDLTIGMLWEAANIYADNTDDVQNLVVDASQLTGDFDLTVYTGLLDIVDAGDNSENILIGTAGLNDILTIDGDDFFENPIFTTEDTTISGFETIAFNDTWGVFDAINVSDVTLYDIVNTDDDLSLINLSGVDTVQINVEESWSIDGGLTFVAEEEDADNLLTLLFRDATDEFDGLDFTPEWDDLQVQNYRELVLDLGGADFQEDDYTFDLTFLDADGDDEWSGAYDYDTVYARTLTVIGGVEDPEDDGWIDSVDLGTVTNVLSTIDFAGYVGTTTIALDIIDSTIVDRNTEVYVNGYTMDFTETEMVDDSHITTFVFTADAVDDTQVWTIDGFDGFQMAGIDLTNLSVLDLSALGIEGLADLNIVDDGADTTITSNSGDDFQIELIGVLSADLSNENFTFAA